MGANLAIYFVIATIAYHTAVMITWRVAFEKSHGSLASWRSILFVRKLPSKALRPIYKAWLVGLLPGSILTPIVIILFPNIGITSFAPVIIGAVISALIVHRHLLSMVNDTMKWNIAIITLSVFVAIAFRYLLFIMLSYFGHL